MEKSGAVKGTVTWIRRARVPLLLIVVGLAITAVMASLQQDSARREQQLLFEQQVTREHQLFNDIIASNIDGFEDGVAFIQATFPGSQQQYQQFFEGSVSGSGLTAFDPGISLIEAVDPTEVEALVERERRLGNPEFAVLALGPLHDGEHLVITRTAEPVTIGGIPLIGLDIGSLALGPGMLTLPDSGRLIYPIADDTAVTSLFATGTADASDLRLVVIVETITDPLTEEVLGWAARFFDPEQFLQNLDHKQGEINVSVEMLGANQLYIDVDPESSSTFEGASLRSQVVDETHGLEWSLELWADEGFGIKTGLLDQSGVWLFGLLATAAFLTVSIWRAVQEHHLDRANFELEHARTLATTDPLTGLLNRQGFLEMAGSASSSEGGTLFFIDLDGFKIVNDTRGHAAGDRMLRTVAQHLHEQFRGVDLVSRYGGDEFVVYTPGLAGRGIEGGISQRVIDAISRSDHEISCSVGTAVHMPGTSLDIEGLLNQADAAMYRAKAKGGGRHEVAMVNAPLPSSPTIDLGQDA